MTERITESTTENSNPTPGPAWMVRAAPFAAALAGLVLAFSALTKFLSPKAFVGAIADYGLFPDPAVLPLATGVVALEFALGLMLLSGVARRVAARIAVPLVAGFILLIIRALATGMTGCGCFGEVISIAPQFELVLDVFLLAMVVVVSRCGEDFSLVGGRVARTAPWVALCVGAIIFLAGGPVVSGESTLDLELDDLTVLATANPPVAIPQEGFFFFFSADCDHCWAYAGGVELMAQRLVDFRVIGVTQSDPAALEAFREAFQPTYPIHSLTPREFNALVADYPAGVWIQGGQIAGSWAGYVPGLRQIAEEGGYFYRPASTSDYGSQPSSENPFGGTLGGRQ